jgi:hypothetical protein
VMAGLSAQLWFPELAKGPRRWTLLTP